MATDRRSGNVSSLNCRCWCLIVCTTWHPAICLPCVSRLLITLVVVVTYTLDTRVIIIIILIRLAVVASQIGEILCKFELIQFTSRCQAKAHMQLPISHFGRIFYSFRDIDAFSFKIACFSQPTLVWRFPSGGTPCNINIIYTYIAEKYSGLQFCRRHYGSIFISLAVVAFRNREITRNSDKIWHYSSSKSSKVIDLGVNRKLMRLPISH